MVLYELPEIGDIVSRATIFANERRYSSIDPFVPARMADMENALLACLPKVLHVQMVANILIHYANL